MKKEQSFLESAAQPITLEDCQDPHIPQEQIAALQHHDVTAYKGVARIAGATVRYNYLEPATVTDEVPIGILNGYCGSEGAYKRLSVELALQGRRVFYMRPPRTQTPFIASRYDHLRDVLKLQSQAAWGIMRDIGDDKGIDIFDIYGHSMGAAIGAKVADQKPKHVRSIVYAGGAGLNGQNTFLGMLLKAKDVVHHDVLEGRQGLREHAPAGLITDTLVHVLRRPDRTVREGFTVARIDIRPQTTRLRQAGVKVGAILFERDGFFPTEQVLAESGHLFNAVEITPDATHVYPQDHPVSHADDVVRLLSRLNNGALPLHNSPTNVA